MRVWRLFGSTDLRQFEWVNLMKKHFIHARDKRYVRMYCKRFNERPKWITFNFMVFMSFTTILCKRCFIIEYRWRIIDYDKEELIQNK